jgi:hypothetical protein
MRSNLSRIKKTILYGAALTLSTFSLFAPLGSVASADACAAPDDSTYGAGIHHPVGAEAVMYTYDCDSGTWNSQYYTYYPASNTKVAQYSPNYSYDCAASKWYKTEYDFSPGDGSYHKNRVVTGDPGLATGCPVAPSSASSASPSNGSGGGTAATGSGAGGNAITNTGPGSSNNTNGSANINSNSSNNNLLSMSNGVNSQSGSGDAGVYYNTSGGSAASGDAQSLANIANLLQSSANVFGPDTATFTADINGDVNGDFMFDPSAVMNTGPGSANSTDNAGNLTINQANNTDASIHNTVDVGAQTGDATVASNTSGGDATSGNASAIVNLMNLINSSVAAGQSFVGTVNINGNLNGDILLPQGLLDQLLASTGPGSTNSDSSGLNVNTTDTNNTTSAIDNNVDATAGTGDATVADNSQAGSASTGNAKTNVTLLNLTGSKVVGADDLLVFVNVLGHWVGMIMNAPAGTTAASLGGGISSTGPGSTNTATNGLNINAASSTNNTLGITNDVNAHAKSGNASVTGNTLGGNAKSGNADTAVNILNIANSSLNLSNWFGVLFINVFGNWTGSFGVNTSAGDPIAAASSQPQTSSGGGSGSSSPAGLFASFIAHHTTSGNGNTSSTNSADSTAASVLGSSTTVAKKLTKSAASSVPTPDNASHASYVLPLIGFAVAGVLLFISERGRFFGSKK